MQNREPLKAITQGARGKLKWVILPLCYIDHIDHFT